MTSALHKDAVVQPDGTIALSVPEIAPGQHVHITIEPAEHSPGQSQHYTAIELMALPLAERHRILAATMDDAAAAFRDDPELMAFSALDGEGWEDPSE
jgi:hypothetical protein